MPEKHFCIFTMVLLRFKHLTAVITYAALLKNHKSSLTLFIHALNK